jgi:hypothetical protein
MQRSSWLGWLLALWLPALGASTAPTPQRAVWIWEQASYAMVESPAAADRAFDFLRRHDVGTLYLYADAWGGRNLIVDAPDTYRDFIARAHRKGFQVYALLGSADLRTEEYVLPGRRKQAMAMLQRVLDYNAAADAATRFDGVNYDIEPHLLDAWDTRKSELLHEYVDLTAAFMAAKRASGQTLAIGPAMPFWYDGTQVTWKGRTRPMSEHVIDLCDYVTLMDYRNQAEGRDGIIAHAANEMRHAADVGKKVVIGLELGPSEPSKVTFRHLREADLARAIDQTTRAYVDSPAFAGFALHHYQRYVEWVDTQRARD